MSWTLRVARRAEKSLARSPAKDRARLVAALAAMQDDPFSGDVVRLQGDENTWCRRSRKAFSVTRCLGVS
jgi:mRNA-degrading endonuclease RelE of RelBE toxin-antitoxin system